MTVSPPRNGTATQAPAARRAMSREYVAGGQATASGQLRRALPAYVDDVSRDFGLDIYEKMLVDAQVAACTTILIASILEEGVSLAPAVDDEGADGYALAVEIRDAAEAMLDDLETPLDDVLWDLLSAAALGNRVAEQVYGVGPGPDGRTSLVLRALKVKPIRSVAFVCDRYLNVLGLVGAKPGQVVPSTALADPAEILPREKFAILTWRPKNGDPRGTALDPATPIPTPDGWRTMDDLRPGDKVFDEQGRIRYVVARQDWEDRPCYELKFRGGDSIIADVNHRWATQLAWERYQGRDPKIRTTQQIVDTLRDSRGLANHSIPWAQPLDYPEQLLPVDPYYLGLWLGDGTGTGAEISCHADDLDETIALISATGYAAVAGVNGRSDHGRLIHVSGAEKWDSRGPSHELRLLGVQRDKDGVDRKHIPEAYLRGSIRQRRALLAGLMDADGSVDRDGRCEFSNTNLNLVEGAAELARSLGVPATVRLHHAARVGSDGYSRKDAWGAYFTPPWSPFNLARKSAKTLNERVQRQHYIVDAQPVANRRTVCIETDGPSHLYLAGRSMIPTHNSVLRPAYDPWWRKRQTIPEYLKYLAQFAGPSIWATPPEHAVSTVDPNDPTVVQTPEEALLANLLDWRNGLALAVPFGTQINAVALQGDGKAFLDAIAECNLEITKAVLTQQLATEEGEHQARAAAQVHQDVLDTLVRQGKQSTVRMLKRDVLRNWVRWNYGDDVASALTPVPTLGTTERRDLPALMNAVAALTRAGYIHPSQQPDIDELLALPVRDLAQDQTPAGAPENATGAGAGSDDAATSDAAASEEGADAAA